MHTQKQNDYKNKGRTRTFNYIEDNTAPLQNNGQFQFAKKHALNLYKSNAIYTFIPKNACTSLRASIAVDNGFLTETQVIKQINWVHNNSYTFSANIKELIMADYTFTILRCPYERLASLFLDKFVDKSPIAWNFFRQSNNKYEPDELTFENLISYISDNSNIINGDIHWRKQSDFLVYEKYDDYFDFSDFKKISKTLKKKLDLQLIDTRDITNHGRENYTKDDKNNYSKVTVKDLHEKKSLGFIPATDSLYTSSLKERVFNIYYSDFQLREKLF